jgi:DHA1 family tetracycline resistance protein-like MFS transporter
MTQRVDPAQQGQLQGALASLMGVAAIISPPLYTGVFALAVENKDAMPGAPLLGAPFFVAAFLLVCSLVAVVAVTKPLPAKT